MTDRTQAGTSLPDQSDVGTTGIHVPTVEWIVTWLRGEEAAAVLAESCREDLEPAEALAWVIEGKWIA